MDLQRSTSVFQMLGLEAWITTSGLWGICLVNGAGGCSSLWYHHRAFPGLSLKQAEEVMESEPVGSISRVPASVSACPDSRQLGTEAVRGNEPFPLNRFWSVFYYTSRKKIETASRLDGGYAQTWVESLPQVEGCVHVGKISRRDRMASYPSTVKERGQKKPTLPTS